MPDVTFSWNSALRLVAIAVTGISVTLIGHAVADNNPPALPISPLIPDGVIASQAPVNTIDPDFVVLMPPISDPGFAQPVPPANDPGIAIPALSLATPPAPTGRPDSR